MPYNEGMNKITLIIALALGAAGLAAIPSQAQAQAHNDRLYQPARGGDANVRFGTRRYNVGTRTRRGAIGSSTGESAAARSQRSQEEYYIRSCVKTQPELEFCPRMRAREEARKKRLAEKMAKSQPRPGQVVLTARPAQPITEEPTRTDR